MASESRDSTVKTHEEILARIRGLTTGIRDGAAAAEEARTVPRETIDALLSAGITRILVPPRFGGYGLGLETWFEVVREIGKAQRSSTASRSSGSNAPLHEPLLSEMISDGRALRLRERLGRLLRRDDATDFVVVPRRNGLARGRASAPRDDGDGDLEVRPRGSSKTAFFTFRRHATERHHAAPSSQSRWTTAKRTMTPAEASLKGVDRPPAIKEQATC